MCKHETLIAVISLTILVCGCGPTEVSVATEGNGTEIVEVQKLTDKQKFTLLRTEAHKRGLRWRIFCTNQHDPKEAFLAEAEANTKAEPWIMYLEDGGQAKWAEFGETQADAAYHLFQSIQLNSEPTLQAWHKPDFSLHRKQCPPDLKGD